MEKFLKSKKDLWQFIYTDSSDIETFRFQDISGYYEFEIFFDEIVSILFSNYGFECMQIIK